jgi:hypothetical protein
MRGRESVNKIFTDPNEWRNELWRQNITGVVKTIKDDVRITKENHGVFILDLKDQAGSSLSSILLENKKLDEANTLIIAVEVKTFVKWISILSDMDGFKIRKPIILYDDGFNCCVVAASGAELFLLRL